MSSSANRTYGTCPLAAAKPTRHRLIFDSVQSSFLQRPASDSIAERGARIAGWQLSLHTLCAHIQGYDSELTHLDHHHLAPEV